MTKFAKDNSSKKIQRAITHFLIFHQVIYSLPSISCPSLKLLAVIFFEVLSFLCPKQKGNKTKKIK